jgi:hypothetical protein
MFFLTSCLHKQLVKKEHALRHIILSLQKLNPFKGANVFVATNNPFDAGSPIPGALAFGYEEDCAYYYFAFVFQGTDSTTFTFAGGTTTFHAGQAISPLPNLRNGVFSARLAQ